MLLSQNKNGFKTFVCIILVCIPLMSETFLVELHHLISLLEEYKDIADSLLSYMQQTL